MLKLANHFLVLTTLLTASVLYGLEHNIRGLERQITHEKMLRIDNTEAIKLLKAEWSSLTRPERLQQLATERLGMKNRTADQFVTMGELDAKIKELSASETTSSISPIDDVLKKMQ